MLIRELSSVCLVCCLCHNFVCFSSSDKEGSGTEEEESIFGTLFIGTDNYNNDEQKNNQPSTQNTQQIDYSQVINDLITYADQTHVNDGVTRYSDIFDYICTNFILQFNSAYNTDISKNIMTQIKKGWEQKAPSQCGNYLSHLNDENIFNALSDLYSNFQQVAYNQLMSFVVDNCNSIINTLFFIEFFDYISKLDIDQIGYKMNPIINFSEKEEITNTANQIVKNWINNLPTDITPLITNAMSNTLIKCLKNFFITLHEVMFEHNNDNMEKTINQELRIQKSKYAILQYIVCYLKWLLQKQCNRDVIKNLQTIIQSVQQHSTDYCTITDNPLVEAKSANELYYRKTYLGELPIIKHINKMNKSAKDDTVDQNPAYAIVTFSSSKNTTNKIEVLIGNELYMKTDSQKKNDTSAPLYIPYMNPLSMFETSVMNRLSNPMQNDDNKKISELDKLSINDFFAAYNSIIGRTQTLDREFRILYTLFQKCKFIINEIGKTVQLSNIDTVKVQVYTYMDMCPACWAAWTILQNQLKNALQTEINSNLKFNVEVWSIKEYSESDHSFWQDIRNYDSIIDYMNNHNKHINFFENITTQNNELMQPINSNMQQTVSGSAKVTNTDTIKSNNLNTIIEGSMNKISKSNDAKIRTANKLNNIPKNLIDTIKFDRIPQYIDLSGVEHVKNHYDKNVEKDKQAASENVSPGKTNYRKSNE